MIENKNEASRNLEKQQARLRELEAKKNEVENLQIVQMVRALRIGQDEVSKIYSFPKSYVSYHKPRAVSKEQRERARQMMIAKNNTKEV